MGFKFSEKSITIQKELSDFMIKNIYPEEENVLNFQKSNLWSNYPKIETLKLKAKEQGKLRLEGKEYVVKDGDVIHFKFNV